MGLEFLLNLLSTLPGSVVYNLLVFLGLMAAVGIVTTEWRHTRNHELRPYLVALWGTLIVHGLAVLLAPTHMDLDSFAAVLSAPLLYAEELLSVLLLFWAYGWSRWPARGWRFLVGVVVAWLILLGIMSLWWYQEAAGFAMTYSIHSWQPVLWYTLLALAAFLAAGVLLTIPECDRMALVTFGLLGLGAILGLLGTGYLGPIWLVGEGAARLLFMVAYPLLAISFYRTVLRDLQSYRQELTGLSNEALRQSQELLFLIEATRSIGEGFDVRELVGEVADNIAMALRAGTVLILLVDNDDPEILNVAASYQILGWKSEFPQEIHSRAYPVLTKVLQNREPLVLAAEEDVTAARSLFDLVGFARTGHLLVQPLLRKARLLGLLVVFNEPTKPPFTYEQGSLATTIGVQLAAAVENTLLYHAIQAKAEELRQLLVVREAELLRETAILESMAEGILVTDAQGYFTVMNSAAEEILGSGRDDFLGRNTQDLIETYPLAMGFDVDTIVGLDKPYEATFNLAERRIRVHAAPVLTPDEARLGVVSILQDITREYLAEESKREFIASISHELRTPLTAIKGYTEVMLSGMAGELPPAFAQFLGVIRENTTRMTSLTNNIISVAEIERGRVGLNYQTTDATDMVNEMLSRYQERIEERMLTVKLDFPDDLPTVEVDPNRLRLILDNLFSNAVKFTYPNGRITVGARGIQGTLGKPTFFSIWISDTGVGIPVEEQNRIWERFYRVENSLSLEAGGLGIGLTITKALVEAHGGRVWVDSTLNEGSTFTVLLPIYRSQGPVAELDLGGYW